VGFKMGSSKSAEDPITGSEIKYAVGDVFPEYIHGGIGAGWAITPSLGIVARDMDRLALAIEDLKVPLARSILRVVIPSIRTNFAVGGRPAWQPLADYTVEVRGSAEPILFRTGRLREAATSWEIWDVGKTSATIREFPPDAWYGVIHQAGIGGMKRYYEAARRMLKKQGRPLTGANLNQEAFKAMDYVLGSPTQVIRGAKKGQAGKYGPLSTQAAINEVPQRQFLMFQEDDIDDILQVFAEWMEDEARKVGRFTGASVKRSGIDLLGGF
jgi:phage gpG-like protein